MARADEQLVPAAFPQAPQGRTDGRLGKGESFRRTGHAAFVPERKEDVCEIEVESLGIHEIYNRSKKTKFDDIKFDNA
ncbi:hypothetical protein, partial [Acidomonas methanolica]